MTEDLQQIGLTVILTRTQLLKNQKAPNGAVFTNKVLRHG